MTTGMIVALDSHGEVRFVGDVARGLQCGCSCPACGSPLVAKQGETNEWHFAHEASQERPECVAGATNLARNLGIEHLQQLHATRRLIFPLYRTRVEVALPWFRHAEFVQWNAQLAGPLAWRRAPSKTEPVATGRLDSGASIALFVQVGNLDSPSMEGLPDGYAHATLLVAPIWPVGVRTRVEAMRVIAETAFLRWGYHPDTFGYLAAAQRAVDDRATAARQQYLAQQEQDLQRSLVSVPTRTRSPSGTTAPEARHAEYPGQMPGRSLQFFRLNAEEAWVFYQLDPAYVDREGGPKVAGVDASDAAASVQWWAIAPAGGQFDGWDESLPPTVGTSDTQSGIYWVRDHLAAVLFLSPLSKLTVISSDPQDFSGK